MLLPVSAKFENPKDTIPQQKISFKGAGDNFIVTIMDAVNRGGYIAEFFAQDGCGFVAPRILTGLNRNREETHEYNWKFAATEAIRELLSGPCFAFIPAIILFLTKKYSGSANDVPIKFISALGDDFVNFADSASREEAGILTNENALKEGFYRRSVRNILKNATEGNLNETALENITNEFTREILEIENVPKQKIFKRIGDGWNKFIGKKVEGSAYDRLCDLTDRFSSIVKQNSGSLKDSLSVQFTTNSDARVGAGFKKFLKHLKNYTEDATKRLSSGCKDVSRVAEFMGEFNSKRISSRFMLITGMDLAVAAFLLIIPKLYKHKDGNPGLNGLPVEHGPILNHPQEKEGR